MAKSYLSLNPLVPWRQMPHPLAWSKLFGRSAPLEVEIGFGNGERLLRHAKAHPDLNFVGVDLSWPAARRALRKIALARTRNVLLVQASAEVALWRLFEPACLHSVEALFPCPWPHNRQIKRRLFGRRFLSVLNNRLAGGASFHMVTDHHGFFSWVLGQIPEQGFKIETGIRGPGLETKYERKWCGQGQNEFFELWLTKIQALPEPALEDNVLEPIRLRSFDQAAVQNRDYNEDVFISFKDLVYDQKKKTGLLHTVVNEDDFLQAFWLQFSVDGSGWLVRPGLGCGLVPTKGVRRALELAASLAQGQGLFDELSHQDRGI